MFTTLTSVLLLAATATAREQVSFDFGWKHRTGATLKHSVCFVLRPAPCAALPGLFLPVLFCCGGSFSCSIRPFCFSSCSYTWRLTSPPLLLLSVLRLNLS